jgi:hypothetical protein
VELRNGYIKGNSAPGAYGGGVQVNSGNFTMTGGTISGNSALSGYGGGVYVFADGNFTMTGGAISGNRAGMGGGVYVVGSFTMTGGVIYGIDADPALQNTANTGGAAVHNSSGPNEDNTIYSYPPNP